MSKGDARECRSLNLAEAHAMLDLAQAELDASPSDLERAMSAAETALATGDAAALGWQLALEQITSLRAGLKELLDVAERMRVGDPKLADNPEEWYAIRDYARKVLNA